MAILDTETTGLDDEACLLEIAVVTASGDVLLDTLVNPTSRSARHSAGQS